MIERKDWRWYGQATHLIVANDCLFHMSTIVGVVLVSTVGAWMQTEMRNAILAKPGGKAEWEKIVADGVRHGMTKPSGMHQIGAFRYYETMVFEVTGYCERPDCDCGALPEIGESVATVGYQTSLEAQAGHLAACEEWSTDAKQAEAIEEIREAKSYTAKLAAEES